MFAKIKAISSYLPETVEKNSELVDKRFIKKLGIVERHIATKEESASDISIKAAEKLFAEYNIDKNETDFILLCTQQPDYLLPHTAVFVQDKLNLAHSVGSMDINLGCSGYIYGLATAKGLIETGVAKKILFITSSLYSKYINKKDLASRPILGDGATATWIEADKNSEESLRAFVFGTDGAGYKDLYIPVSGSRFMPHDVPEEFYTDENNNYRSNYEFVMDGKAIANFILDKVPRLVDDVLNLANLTRADLNYCFFHQANKFMNDYVQIKSGLENVPFFNDLATTGNLASGSVPYGIEQTLKNVDAKNLKNVLLAGFGVGLSWAGCIADLSDMWKKF